MLSWQTINKKLLHDIIVHILGQHILDINFGFFLSEVIIFSTLYDLRISIGMPNEIVINEGQSVLYHIYSLNIFCVIRTSKLDFTPSFLKSLV